MPKPICVPCQRFYRCVHIGFTFIEGMPDDNTTLPGTQEPEKVSEIDIRNEPCDCPKGQCAAFVDRDEHCINRRVGDVRTFFCKRCDSHTWHENGVCCRCGIL